MNVEKFSDELRVGAVSYTHLDVYKRQNAPGAVNARPYQLGTQFLGLQHILGRFSGIHHMQAGHEPVSYTHLDVYKRQRRRFQAGRGGPASAMPAGENGIPLDR